MSRYLSVLLAFYSALFLVSCESIPEGPAPKGAIVESKPLKETYNVNEAGNLLANEISMKLVSLPAKSGLARKLFLYIPEKTSPSSSGLSAELLKKLKRTGLAVVSAKGEQEYVLYSSVSEDGQFWICGIYQADGHKLLWSRTLSLERKAAPAPAESQREAVFR